MNRSREMRLVVTLLFLVVSPMINKCPGTLAQSSSEASTGSCPSACQQCARSGHVAELQARVIAMENKNDYAECDIENLQGRTAPLEEKNPTFRDCSEVYESGWTLGGPYLIQPNGSQPFPVLCEFDEDGQWTVIQRRVGGDVNFDRNWNDYKHGFGRLGYNLDSWLGLEKIHLLTQQQSYTLRVEVSDWDGNKAHADYTNFRIDGEDEDYTLRYGAFIGGAAGDSLSIATSSGYTHNGQKFTTKDRDNDKRGDENCSVIYPGGWWYANCHTANLNGQYLKPPGHTSTWRGISWRSWRSNYSLMYSSMRIKASDTV